jgi:prepilin-type N-terminal cleavage/methylation domain-containing protein
MNRRAGFTLIELLVAITIMGVMAVICWRGLSYVADRRAAVEADTLELSRMMRTFAQIERDVDERIPDLASPARATTPGLPLALVVLPAAEGAELQVLRALAAPSGPSTILPVQYLCASEGLVRRTPGGSVVLLPGVVRLKIRINSGGFWVEPGPAQPVRPFARATAVEIALEDRNGARYVKVIAL